MGIWNWLCLQDIKYDSQHLQVIRWKNSLGYHYRRNTRCIWIPWFWIIWLGHLPKEYLTRIARSRKMARCISPSWPTDFLLDFIWISHPSIFYCSTKDHHSWKTNILIHWKDERLQREAWKQMVYRIQCPKRHYKRHSTTKVIVFWRQIWIIQIRVPLGY